MIYIARNPKDVAISLYHHAKNKPEFEFSYDFNTFLNLFLNGEVESNSWFDHVQEWWLECQKYPSGKMTILLVFH